MREYRDYQGREIILTDTDIQHIIRGHPEMEELGLENVIGETLEFPSVVAQRDPVGLHYYRWYADIKHGKYIRVVVSVQDNQGFVRTAHLTERLIKGRVLWESE